MKLIDDKSGRTIKRHGKPFPGGKMARRIWRKTGVASVFKRRRKASGKY